MGIRKTTQFTIEQWLKKRSFTSSACVCGCVWIVSFFFICMSASEHQIIRPMHLSTGMWLMKRNLLMCLQSDISKDLLCSLLKLKPLTFFRLTFPQADGSVSAHAKWSQRQRHNYIGASSGSVKFCINICAWKQIVPLLLCMFELFFFFLKDFVGSWRFRFEKWIKLLQLHPMKP